MEREKFKEQALKSIDAIFSKIDELEVKKENATTEIKGEIDEKIKALKAKKADLQQKYNNLMEAKDEKWEEVKEAFSSAADSFKEGFSKITSLFD